jgi:hypothetical protein
VGGFPSYSNDKSGQAQASYGLYEGINDLSLCDHAACVLRPNSGAVQRMLSGFPVVVLADGKIARMG